MPRTVRLGTRDVIFPSSKLDVLTDNTSLMSDVTGLRDALNNQGYLLLRGLHRREDVLNARHATLNYVNESGAGKLVGDVMNGILEKRCGIGCIPAMEGVPPITHSKEVLNVIEGERPKAFFHKLFGEEPLTFDYKWLRGMHVNGFTGVHVDRVYMNQGTDNLYTMWTPFDDIPGEMGTLAICEGSHQLDSFRPLQETYGNLDVEKDNFSGSGWFTNDPFEITDLFGGQWKTTDFQAGDVLIFTMRTVHMSTVNLTNKIRISCDTRWQPRCDKADSRFMGDGTYKNEKSFGLFAPDSLPDSVTMDHLKHKWGFC